MKSIIVITTVIFSVLVQGQLPDVVTNAVFGPDSLVRGVKNIMGGLVALDNTHSKCMMKKLCKEFSNEVVDRTGFDPVKRTFVHHPKVIQRRGSLRWIGDLVANGFNGMARLLSVGNNRRHISVGPGHSIMGSIPIVGPYLTSRMAEIPRGVIVQ